MTLAHAWSVTSVCVAPDGVGVMTGSIDNRARSWDLRTGACARTFSGHEDEVTCVGATPDGTTLVTGSRDHTMRCWPLADDDASTLDALARPARSARASRGLVKMALCASFADSAGDYD